MTALKKSARVRVGGIQPATEQEMKFKIDDAVSFKHKDGSIIGVVIRIFNYDKKIYLVATNEPSDIWRVPELILSEHHERIIVVPNILEQGCKLPQNLTPDWILNESGYLFRRGLPDIGDPGVTSVYRAEDKVWCLYPEFTKKQTIFELQHFLGEIFLSDWFYDRFSLKMPKLLFTKSKKSTYSWITHKIRLNSPDCNKSILIHELAHACTPKHFQPHGPMFCRIYIELVRQFLSEDAAKLLEKSFNNHNVRLKPWRG